MSRRRVKRDIFLVGAFCIIDKRLTDGLPSNDLRMGLSCSVMFRKQLKRYRNGVR